MSKPIIHAKNSARKYGGKWEDYIELHQFMDSSKGAVPSNMHRVLTHNTWFISPNGPLEKAFGVVIKNSEGKDVSVRDLGEQHISEDFGGLIPTVQDYLAHMEYHPWMGADYRFGKPHSSLDGRVTKTIPDKPKFDIHNTMID